MKYRVFFNSDCMMYGVQKRVSGISAGYRGAPARWTQVLPPKKSYGARHGQSAYTNYKGVADRWLKELEARDRLEVLRRELRAERISYGELAELQSLARYIAPGDVELLEAAGVPEAV